MAKKTSTKTSGKKKTVTKVKKTKRPLAPTPKEVEYRPTVYFNGKQVKNISKLKIGQKVTLTAVVTATGKNKRKGEGITENGEFEITGVKK